MRTLVTLTIPSGQNASNEVDLQGKKLIGVFVKTNLTSNVWVLEAAMDPVTPGDWRTVNFPEAIPTGPYYNLIPREFQDLPDVLRIRLGSGNADSDLEYKLVLQDQDKGCTVTVSGCS